MSALTPEMLGFLELAGWGRADAVSVTPDWSPRAYWRLTKGDQTAIFLQGPAQDFRGHGLKDFVAIGQHLKTMGLSAPEIYASDLNASRLLMEDFGDTPIDTPDIETEAYEMAVDVLAVLRTDQTLKTTLPHYEDFYVFKKTELFATQYAKRDSSGWWAVWDKVLSALPPCPHVLTHIDYKAGNLHWLPQRHGVRRIGILDYQAAQNAPFVYDLMTLLEDARRDVDPALKAALKQRFIATLPDDWKDLFDVWYAICAVQFHAGVLGQITGRDHIPADMPQRLKNYLRNELQHTALAPLAAWCKDNEVSL